MTDQHFRPLFVTALPRERRAWHPYQLGVMGWLISMGGSQLFFGLTSNSSLNKVPADQVTFLSWYCVIAGIAGIAAAFIPERVVKVIRPFDATWVRLIVEGACHGVLVFVWAAYFVAVSRAVGYVNGLSFGTGAALFLGCAAGGRAVQIGLTVWRVLRPSSVPVSTEVIGQARDG